MVWMKAAGGIGSILVLIALVITLVKNLIVFVGFITFVFKILIVLLFIAVICGVGFLAFKAFSEKRRNRDQHWSYHLRYNSPRHRISCPRLPLPMAFYIVLTFSSTLASESQVNFQGVGEYITLKIARFCWFRVSRQRLSPRESLCWNTCVRHEII